MISPAHLAFAAAFLLVVRSSAPGAAAARPIFDGKPSPSEATATARWLAAQNTWGVLRHLLFLQLKMVDLQSSEADLAKSALFTKHPEMKDWPKNHHFKIFKMEIENIFLIDWFGGPKPISPSQYLEFGR
ncbi:Pyridoxamine 5'-phosphate oxidase family protein [Zea mays]|uniref:Pyridoxamine 5'-phosphate oxidase family protein n=1 Tax=Zea mays TaxID=4577 RepID=A0A1D6LW05_MAIZE|nr:Pyridoxamine 5'-phosphate oxidase family protein [Zea mays]